METEIIPGSSGISAHVPAYEAFRLWAEVYDSQLNPMLALESTTGLVVIDEVQRQPALLEIIRVLVDRPGPARHAR